MTEQEAFEHIDRAIQSFLENNAQSENISVWTVPHSDWLIFKWRQLHWLEQGINYIIEIYPNFNKNEKIESWTMYAAAWYDEKDKRYYINKKVADKKTLDSIASNSPSLLKECAEYLNKIKKADIPFGTDLANSKYDLNP